MMVMDNLQTIFGCTIYDCMTDFCGNYIMVKAQKFVNGVSLKLKAISHNLRNT